MTEREERGQRRDVCCVVATQIRLQTSPSHLLISLRSPSSVSFSLSLLALLSSRVSASLLLCRSQLETVTVLCRALFERDNDTGVSQPCFLSLARNNKAVRLRLCFGICPNLSDARCTSCPSPRLLAAPSDLARARRPRSCTTHVAHFASIIRRRSSSLRLLADRLRASSSV